MKIYSISILLFIFLFNTNNEQSYTSYKIDNGTLDSISKRWTFKCPKKCNLSVKVINGTFLINDCVVFISDNIPIYNKRENYSINTFNGVDVNNRFGQVSLTESKTLSTIDFVLKDTCFVLFVNKQ